MYDKAHTIESESGIVSVFDLQSLVKIEFVVACCLKKYITNI